MACRDGVDGEFRSCIHVSAHENIRLSGLIGQLIRHDGRAIEGHVLALQQIAPDASLAYRENHAVTINPDGLIFVIGRREAALCVLDRGTLLKDDTGHPAVLGQNLLRSPAVLNLYAVFICLAYFVIRCRHLCLRLQTKHMNLAGSASGADSGRVDGYVSAAYDHDSSGVRGLAGVGLPQIINGCGGSFRVVSGHAGSAARAAADGDIEGLVALLTELFQGHIFADLHAGLNLHAHLAHHVDFRCDDVFFQFIGGDAVAEHTAGLLILLKYCGTIALLRQIEGRTHTCRAAADDGDFLREMLHMDAGRNHHGRNIAGLCLQILLRDELFHCVDGYRPVNGASGAGVLTAAVADASADCREGILLLD